MSLKKEIPSTTKAWEPKHWSRANSTATASTLQLLYHGCLSKSSVKTPNTSAVKRPIIQLLNCKMLSKEKYNKIIESKENVNTKQLFMLALTSYASPTVESEVKPFSNPDKLYSHRQMTTVIFPHTSSSTVLACYKINKNLGNHCFIE